MKAFFRSFAITVLAIAISSSSSWAAPPDVNEGRARFNRGVELFREGDFGAAMIEFRRAYEVAPNYRVLFNIGQTAFELRDYAAALDAFERYLADGGKDVPAKRRKMVSEEIDKLKTRVAQIEIKTSIDGAEVFVDDVSIGVSPLAKPVRVSAGLRRISASHEGVRAEKRVEIAGGDTRTIELDLAAPRAEPSSEPTKAVPPAPRAPVTTHEPAREAPKKTGAPTRVWIGVAVTGALTAGAVVSGVLAVRSKREYDDTLETFGSDSKEIERQRDRTRQLALLTDVLGGAAVVAGAVTVYFALSADGAPSREASRAPRIGIGPRGVTLGGRF